MASHSTIAEGPSGTFEKEPNSPTISSAKLSASDHKDEPPPFKPTTRFLLSFASLAVLTLMVALDGTSISVAIPIVSKKLNGSAIEAFWSGTAFLLAATVFQPNFASFSHIFGRMPIILICMTFFLAGVLMAALANGFGLLLAGRTIQGIGGGGILAMTEIVVTDLVPLRYRGQWAGVIAAMWSIGSVSGPIIGGAFAQVNWRWIFWLNLPFIAVAFVMVPLFIRLNVIPSSIASKLKRVDWIGSVIFVGSTTSLLIPLTWGGVMYPWTSWRTLVPLLIGVAGLIAFCLYERFLAPEPTVRLSIFSNATANTAYFTATIHGIVLWTVLYYQPLYYEGVKGYKPIIAGVALFPATFTVAPMAVVTGFAITKSNAYRWTIYIGWLLTTLGLGLTILMKPQTTIPQFIFINIVPGMGLGVLFPAIQFQLQAATKNTDMAFAVAMFVFFRTFGQTIGVAIGGVIFQNQMVKNLGRYPRYAEQAMELARDAAALVEVIKETRDGVGKLELQTAYTDSIRTVYIVMCVLAGVCLVSCVWIKAYDLNVALETEQGLVERGKVGEFASKAESEGLSAV